MRIIYSPSSGAHSAPLNDPEWILLTDAIPIVLQSRKDPDVLKVLWTWNSSRKWPKYAVRDRAIPKGPHNTHFQKHQFENLAPDNRLGRGTVSADTPKARYKFGVEEQKDALVIKELCAQVEGHLKKIKPIIERGPFNLAELNKVQKKVDKNGPDKSPAREYRFCACHFEYASDPNGKKSSDIRIAPRTALPCDKCEYGHEPSEDDISAWLTKHKKQLRPVKSEDEPYFPSSCPECGGRTHTVEGAFWTCGDCSHEWQAENMPEHQTSETEQTDELNFPLEEMFAEDGVYPEEFQYEDSEGLRHLAPGFQEKRPRRGDRKDPLLSWPEEQTIIKRLNPGWYRAGPSRKAAIRLGSRRYRYQQLGWTTGKIAQCEKLDGWPSSEEAVTAEIKRFEDLIKQIISLNATHSGTYFTLGEVSDRVGIPLRILVQWLKAGWIEGTGIDTGDELDPIHPSWVLSLKQMLTLSKKWKEQPTRWTAEVACSTK